MHLSVIIPARDEARRLPLALEAVAGYLEQHDTDCEVIVVDAGSKDDTAAVARSFADRMTGLRVLSIANTGARNNKGMAVRTGMLAASGDARCFIDSDNGAPFEQIEMLVPLLGEYDVVIGSRYVTGGDPGRRSIVRRIVSRGGNLVFRLFLGIPQRDTHCPLKLYSASAAHMLFGLSRVNGLGFDAEVLTIAAHRGLRVAEVPVRWDDVEGSSVRARTIFEAFTEVALIRRALRRGFYDQEPVGT